MANQTAAQTRTLGKREGRVYRRSFRDGLLDLFCGLALILVGVAWIFDIVALGPLAPAILIPLWGPVRRRIVEPRTGFVRFHPEREALEDRKYLRFFAVGCGFFVAGVAVYFLVRGGDKPDWGHLVAGLPGLLLAAAAMIAGRAFGLARFWVYAIVLVASGTVAIVGRLDPGWSILGGGVVMALAGGLLLIRFVRRYPVIDAGE